MKELIAKVSAYSYTERIQRLIQIAAKEPYASPIEMAEMQLIQGIREANGEIALVKQYREREAMEETKSKNLNEGIIEQINRVKEILKQYEAIGQPGQFTAALMDNDIKRAEKALGRGDVVEMVKLYNKLREWEL